MKKIILAIITVLAVQGVFGQSGFNITGDIVGIENGKIITLTPGGTHQSEKPLFTAVVADGKFTLKGKLTEPRFFYLGVEGVLGTTPLFVENTKITIKGKYASKDNTHGVFTDIVVTGSDVHTQFLEKGKVRDDLDKAYTAYHEASKGILDSLQAVKRGSDEFKKLQESAGYKKFEADEKAFFNNVSATYKKTILDNAKTFWGPFFMMNFMSYFTDEQKSWYEAFSPEAKNSYYGKLVKAELFPVTLLGKVAPKFSSPDRDGKILSLKEQMGKYTIIDFWASWCAPCRKEIPNLKKLYDKYNAKGLAIISVSLDKEDDKWKKALDEEQLKWANVIDKNEIAKSYGVTTIPDMFIVDKSGKVVGIKLRGESLADKLKELFGE